MAKAKISKKVSEADELKAYKAAKTPKEMVESWGLLQGGKADIFHERYGVFEEKSPHLDIIKTFVQDPEIRMMERGILDPKIKELARLAIAICHVNTTRVTTQVVAAKARGATDDDIMETVYQAVYGIAKSALGRIGMAVKDGWQRAETQKTWEKLQEVRKKGKKYIVDEDVEIEALKTAKTQDEMMASWSIEQGTSMEDALAEVKNWDGPARGFKIYDEKAPHLNIIKDFMQDPFITNLERCMEGSSTHELRECVWWVLCALVRCEGALSCHVGFLLGRGVTQEEIMELFYLLGTELHRAEMERIGPALAEGFRRAAELGL